MSRTRQSPEVVALKTIWPALLFAAVWVQFEGTQHHLTVSPWFTYALLIVIGLVTVCRTRMALKRPNTRVLRYFPAFDCLVLALVIRFTGGVHSELWLFYYFLLIAGAMDPRPRTIELTAPLVIISYLAATAPHPVRWDWPVTETVGTRLFFLVLASLLTRQVALARNKLSDELGRLSEQLGLSQERNRIAREIHDGVGHSLVNCILTLELCERLVCKEPEEACKVIRQEKEDLRSALDDMRDYVHHLRPAEIENEEFVPLVKRYLSRFADRTGLTAKVEINSKSLDLPPSSRLVLLRIMQESLTNSAKHSEASEVDVSLARTSDGGVHCVISDNGCGFDEEEVLKDSASRQGFGLRTMRDRAIGVGGDVQIESAPGEGTKVSVYIPG
ncbi:MAG: sensor histidine kinase [Chloroflexi bacterium]|nr:sensor histidine kinase [Chloroflexota bacterium]